MSNVKILTVIVFCITLSLSIFYRFGCIRIAFTKKSLNAYSKEYDAAYQKNKVIFKLHEHQSIFILYDTYGKDYWACYIRTKDFKYGWVLCTDLTKEI